MNQLLYTQNKTFILLIIKIQLTKKFLSLGVKMNFVNTVRLIIGPNSDPNSNFNPPVLNPPLRLVVKNDVPEKIESKCVILIDPQLQTQTIKYRHYLQPTAQLGQGSYKKVYKATIEDSWGKVSQVARLVTTLFPYERGYENSLALWNHENRIMRHLAGASNVLQQITNFAYNGTSQGQECEKYNVITPLADCSLYDYLKRHNFSIPYLDQYQIFKGALTGLAEMHRRGVLHLDIKEENLLVTKQEFVIDVSISDFGLSQMWAEIQDPKLKADKITTSTYMYMSPEQCKYTFISPNPETLDSITLNRDVWAMGLIFYKIFFQQPHPLSLQIKEVVDIETKLISLYDDLKKYEDPITLTEAEQRDYEEKKKTYATKMQKYKTEIQNLSTCIDSLPSPPMDTCTPMYNIYILIMKMLHPDPKQRISAEEALRELFTLGIITGFENTLSKLHLQQIVPPITYTPIGPI